MHMNIGIDARFYGSLGKGLGRYTEKLLTHLEVVDHDYSTYFIFLRSENFDEYQPRSKRFIKVRADYPWYGWQEQLLFPFLLSRYRLDLIHFPHFNVPIFVPVPFIVTIHDLILLHYPTVKATELPPFLYWLKYLAYRAVIGLAVRRARAIITVSQFTKSDLEDVYAAARGKVTVTLEAADPFCYWLPPRVERAILGALGLSELTEGVEVIDIKRFILYVGNAYPHKNLDQILAVARQFPELIFVCVGKEDFFYHSFRAKVESANQNNIRFVGGIDDQTLGILYRRASAYFFPSLYEGFGLPGLEAMAYGIPVVAARAGSLPEIYGDAAYFFDPADEAGCRAMIALALDGARTSDSERQARFRQSGKFSWQRMAYETLHVYRTASERRSNKNNE